MTCEVSQYIEKHSAELSRLCLSLCNNRHDAEDLFQITWEKVIRNIRKYDPKKPFDKWLWTVCVNAHKDMMKNPFRKRSLPFKNTEEMEQMLRSVPDKETSIDEYIALHDAIRHLTLKKRQVIALYYFKDYSTAELADILNISEGTVKSRLSSAREEIRKELFDE